MAFMNWSDEIAIGIKEIDDQHKKLVACIQCLSATAFLKTSAGVL